MNELVFIERNEPYTTSEIVAERAGIKHHAVQQMIAKHESSLKEFGTVAFEMRACPHKTGASVEKVYHLNEQQALLLFTLLRNTPTVTAFKIELIRQFCAMRELLAEQKTTLWRETQHAGKMVRRSEGDVIKTFIAYAKQQGSHNADKYYIQFSLLANHAAGITERKLVDTVQLSVIMLVENLIKQTIINGMVQNQPYKAIYANCKKRVQTFKALAAVPQIVGMEAI